MCGKKGYFPQNDVYKWGDAFEITEQMYFFFPICAI